MTINRSTHGSRRAFSLIEVAVAVALFFMAIFAILGLVGTNLRNIRRIQQPQADAGPVIADLYLTNKLQEGVTSGDFGDIYPGYHWTQSITEVGTNGFFQVDYVVVNTKIQPPGENHLSVLLYRPDSITGLGMRPQ